MQWLAFIIIGLGIGILAGLSVSPVLSIILTSLMAAAATLAAVLGGYQKDAKDRKVNALPLAVLVMFILLGAGCGMYGRINWSRSLGADVRAEALYPPSQHHLTKIVQQWKGLGLDETTVKNKIFEIYIAGGEALVTKSAEQNAQNSAVSLFGTDSATPCQRLLGASDAMLRNEMLIMNDDIPVVPLFAKQTDDINDLREFVEVVCSDS